MEKTEESEALIAEQKSNRWSFERNGIFWWMERPPGWTPGMNDQRKHRPYEEGDQSWLPENK